MSSAAAHHYTIVCEYDGGTYISQVRAVDEQRAVEEWAKHLRLDNPFPGSDLVADSTAGEGIPVALEGLIGVWCWTATADKNLVLATIVRSIGDLQ